LLAATLLGLLNKKLSLILMFIFFVTGYTIIHITGCFGWKDQCDPFSPSFYFWNYLAAGLCTFLSDTLTRIARR
jgi:hypothetical protein